LPVTYLFPPEKNIQKMIPTNLNNSDKVKSLLITGGSGFVGGHLTNLLLEKGYKVSHLSVKNKHVSGVRFFEWNIRAGTIDIEALHGIDCIVHLAGANIGANRWTKKRKAEIVNSRVDSAKLLFKTLSDQKIKLKAFISASAVGYYGSEISENIFSEENEPGKDFLANTCRLWEKSADLFAETGVRTVKIRTGIVLDKNEGALPKLYNPAHNGFVIRTGSGRQYMPWIHIVDLCNIYLKAIEDNNMDGPYNAVSPQHTDHNNFIRFMAGIIKRPLFLPPVPSFVLKIILGEMADLVLKGNRVSSQKIREAGYSFKFSDLEGAFKDLLFK
jgi:uncharacterized protein (TIGR01777 family)